MAPAELLDDAGRDGQAEARPLARRLRREERLEDALEDGGRRCPARRRRPQMRRRSSSRVARTVDVPRGPGRVGGVAQHVRQHLVEAARDRHALDVGRRARRSNVRRLVAERQRRRPSPPPRRARRAARGVCSTAALRENVSRRLHDVGHAQEARVREVEHLAAPPRRRRMRSIAMRTQRSVASSGLLSSWATPAASLPIMASFSCTRSRSRRSALAWSAWWCSSALRDRRDDLAAPGTAW